MRRVLIVEADARLRDALSQSLRAAGWQTQCAGHLAGALDALEASPADGVLLDVADSAALEGIDELRRRSPRAAVVAMGSRPSLETAVEAMKRGACDFLRKPFRIESLEAAFASALRAAPGGARRSGPFLTRDPAMERVLAQARAAAATDVSVLILGESGTGKELLAQLIHRASARRNGPFVCVSCVGLPESLAESELFGHERGAFTGAVESRLGQVASADGGTLLLDGVSDLAAAVQPKLLRVLQEREVQPVGALAPRPVDVRVVATSQRDLREAVAAGRFREDLYYRLDVVPLEIPPLRERPDDVVLLAQSFCERLAAASGAEPPQLGEEALRRLARHPFPGNVRELENLMRRAVVLYAGREVDAARLLERRTPVDASPSGTLNLRDLERRAIARALGECGGNRTLAARALGISTRTLRNKLRRYGFPRATEDPRGSGTAACAGSSSRAAPEAAPMTAGRQMFPAR